MEQDYAQTVRGYIAEAERKAGELMLSAGENVAAEDKTSRRDVVTSYDRRVQELMVEELSRRVPGARFYCEELAERCPLDGEKVFIIDPIDGTMNFVHGLGHSCVSTAFSSGGALLAAGIYNPYARELFTAARGRGASLNGREIRAAETDLAHSVVHFGTTPYDPQLADRAFLLARKVFEKSLDLRRRGSAALDLCDVAAGRVGLYFEMALSLWDYAAGVLLVEEAGGVCRRLDGSPLPLDGARNSVLAGNAGTVREFLDLSAQY